MNKKIYLTIDIECHDINRKNQYIDGEYKDGNCGLKHILDLSKELDVPVNCFLNIPEAKEYGDKYIQDIIDLIHKYDQHVYLHLHPDYITGDKNRSFLWEYSGTEKKEILQEGFELYRRFLGHEAKFFRVGRYGADPEMYDSMNELGLEIIDLSYCSNSPKMCHIDLNELRTNNAPVMYKNQLIMPNTRYLGLKLLKRKAYINFDASDTSFNEFKRIIDHTKLEQLVLTMHSWNFIKKYFFLDKYVSLDKYEERKFRKMVRYARSKGFIFSDLSTIPPSIEGAIIDEEIDLCEGIKNKPAMICNNFVRFKRIGRLNKKYFSIYTALYLIVLAIIAIIILF